MKLTNLFFILKINGYEFEFKRNDETKVWTFSDHNATISQDSIEDAIDTMQTVIKIVKVLNKTTDATVVETVGTISQGDAA